jgi:cell fate regulator YaaT (PSP1 superfamily)
MRVLGVMVARDSDSFRRGSEVIVRSNRGIETAQVLCEASDDALSHLDQPPTGNILREMTDDDVRELAHVEQSRDEKNAICQKHINELGLNMQLVEIEQLLGGERIVIYYLAEDRVDFRVLVKNLASEFQTRIEMKQIGVRDEAKILADYGDCGRPVCCNTHLSKMPPVSMKMAKVQKATLDPTKISGRCGRLKCCLRYEYDTYEEIQKQLPRVGTHIVTREGRGRVIGQEILAEQLLIETEDHRRILIDASEVLSTIKKENRSSSDSRQHREPTSDTSEKNKNDSRRSGRDNRKDPRRGGAPKNQDSKPQDRPRKNKNQGGGKPRNPKGKQNRDSSGEENRDN